MEQDIRVHLFVELTDKNTILDKLCTIFESNASSVEAY